MGKYINLNREEINKRVEELIAQYAEQGIELKLDSTDIYDKQRRRINSNQHILFPYGFHL